nr:hypothetical protein [Tanacetum cinerariifolium]
MEEIEAWSNLSVDEDGSIKSLHNKLKGLKFQLKLWYSHTKEVKYRRKKNITSSLRNIEEKIDAGCANDEHRTLRVNRLQELDGLEKLESMDLIQKALVKWEELRLVPPIFLYLIFYAGDVIIIFDWNQNDMDNIIQILNVFYIAFDLKININKSNLYGVGISSSEIDRMTAGTCCVAGSFPFSYLGLPIDSNTGRIVKLKELIDRFKARLPHRFNLSSRGLDIDSIMYPVCNGHVESNIYVFFFCDTTSIVWRLVRA